MYHLTQEPASGLADFPSASFKIKVILQSQKNPTTEDLKTPEHFPCAQNHITPMRKSSNLSLYLATVSAVILVEEESALFLTYGFYILFLWRET